MHREVPIDKPGAAADGALGAVVELAERRDPEHRIGELASIRVDQMPSEPTVSVFLGFNFWNGAIKLGASVPRKNKLLISSVSSSVFRRMGNPLWNWVMPETSQSFSTLPVNP